MSQLLNSMQVAQFVDEGFLIFEGVVPEDLCAAAIAETRAAVNEDSYVDIKQQAHHFNWDDALQGSVYKQIIEMPIVQGAIQSLVGTKPLFDHFRIHRTLPTEVKGVESFLQMHQDCMLDMRPFSFDINVSIYPQAVSKDMGGTLLLPGSQYRKVHNANIHRYQHVRGSKQLVCEAGTVVIWHGNLWHSGRPNRSDSDRIMFLARFNPLQAQQKLWDMSDLDQEAVAQLMLRGHPWIGGEHPVEWLNRIRQWRYMSGDNNFDFMGYGKRICYAYEQDQVEEAYARSVLMAMPC